MLNFILMSAKVSKNVTRMVNPMMTKHRKKRSSGMTLIEIMVAAVVLLIAVLGTTSIRYHTVINARKAEAQISAARVGSLLCDSWRGYLGNAAYDPVTALSSAIMHNE